MADDVIKLPMYFRLTPPGGEPFFVKLHVHSTGEVVVLTDRSGAWEMGDGQLFADVLFPEQQIADWDYEVLDPDDDDEVIAIDQGVKDFFARDTAVARAVKAAAEELDKTGKSAAVVAVDDPE